MISLYSTNDPCLTTKMSVNKCFEKLNFKQDVSNITGAISNFAPERHILFLCKGTRNLQLHLKSTSSVFSSCSYSLHKVQLYSTYREHIQIF